MSWLYISGNQRHGGVLRVGGPNPEGEREGGSFKPRTNEHEKESTEIHYHVLHTTLILTGQVLK